MSGATLPSPRIEIRQDAPFFRLGIVPADAALPEATRRPTTYASHQSALREAEIVRSVTGWPIIDFTLSRGGGHG